MIRLIIVKFKAYCLYFYIKIKEALYNDKGKRMKVLYI